MGRASVQSKFSGTTKEIARRVQIAANDTPADPPIGPGRGEGHLLCDGCFVGDAIRFSNSGGLGEADLVLGGTGGDPVKRQRA